MNAAGAPPTFEQTLRALLPETAATAAQEPLADLDYAAGTGKRAPKRTQRAPKAVPAEPARRRKVARA